MKFHTSVLMAAAISAFGGAARGELTADQIAVIVNSDSKGSRDIALQYQAARGIPRENIIFVQMNLREDTDEPTYNLKLKAPIRRYLLEHKLDKKITCLVTTYDIPLRVGPQSPSPADQPEILALRRQMIGGMEELQQSVAAFDAILPALATTAPATPDDHAKPAVPTLDELTKSLDAAAHRAVDRIGKADGDQQKHAAQAYVALYERLLGVGGAITSRDIALLATDATELAARLRPRIVEMQKADAEIVEISDRETEPAVRARRLELMRKEHGVFGTLRQVERDLNNLERGQSDASVDNELACLWNDHYFKADWVWNPVSLEKYDAAKYRAAAATAPGTQPADGPFRPLLVTRLDGSTPAKVLEMINTSLKIEKAGLDGTLYFDAKGDYNMSTAYGVFDSDIRAAAAYLKANSTMPVVLDDKVELLQAKDCPNAAAYCGWYNPGNYVESCQWLPGAVGYHVASGELWTLHEPGAKGWCKNLLDRGFAGTLGPTTEPYLHSFPKPSQFFPLLLSGQWTQGEVFYMTQPLVSWRIAFVGDPLYNPFKNKPRIKVETLKKNPLLAKAFEICPPTAQAASQPGK